VIFIVYVDDGIFASPSQKAIDQAIKELKELFDMEDQGSISTNYLEVNVEHLPNGDIKLSQLHLIDQIIDDVHISKQVAGKQKPAAATKILKRDEAAPSFNQQFNYWCAVCKLNFLEKSTRPDISYATHQVARFSEDSRISHGDTIEHIVKYSCDTRNDGIAKSSHHIHLVFCCVILILIFCHLVTRESNNLHSPINGG
jgi:hypothetical protein